MKTNSTRSNLLAALLVSVGFLVSTKSFAQPDLDFRHPVLIAGTDKQVGAVYLFSDVKEGVDARVSYIYISPGTVVHEVDGGSGFNGALQPGLNLNAYTKGYLEMYIEFLHAGTNRTFVQAEVGVTCLDVDGTGRSDAGTNRINEFNEVNLGGGYTNYLLNGTELSIVQSGTWIKGSNVRGIEYTERDTTAKQVMFTAVNTNISALTIRVGVDNQKSRTERRQSSVYFKKFSYANSVLASSSLLSFRGIRGNNNVELLWKVDPNNSLNKVVIERATTTMKYVSIGEIKVGGQSAAQENYTFIDHAPNATTQLYRLKMINENGEIHYSKVLVFRLENGVRDSFGIYPNIVQNTMNIQIETGKTGNALLQIVDYSGRMILQTNVFVQEGNNNIVLNNLSTLTKGSYIVLLKVDNQVYHNKIIKQ